jgi:seryl-tRNA synthetase
MLDIGFIKENKDRVKAAIKSRKVLKVIDVDLLLEKYNQYLDLLRKTELHRALRNKLSEDISKIKGEERQKLINEASQIKTELQEMEVALNEKKNEIDADLTYIPNINSDEMPVGQGEEDNPVLKIWSPKEGYVKKTGDLELDPGFKLKDHLELGEILGVIDTEQSSKVSGSRFYYLKNELVLLQDAVFALLKRKLQEEGYKPLVPPLLVRERSLFGTSHFPESKSQIYKIENFNVEEGNELYLVGSSEPANFSYFMDKILDKEELPIKIYAQTPCFRSEVGSWGKDVKGIKRVHQFDKLEMNVVCTEDQERKLFDEFLSINEWMLQKLQLPYRIINKCTGDCGYAATFFQYDWDYWRPGEKEFMEGGTNTLTTDYQARRLNIRYREGKNLKFAHTLNDTGVTSRVLIAILENYQNPDGSVTVPNSLADMVGFKKILAKKT